MNKTCFIWKNDTCRWKEIVLELNLMKKKVWLENTMFFDEKKWFYNLIRWIKQVLLEKTMFFDEKK